MTLIPFADRVAETTTTTGTGSISLGGAQSGYQSFLSVATAGLAQIYYTIADQSGSNWESGIGTLATGPTLTRTTVLASSNTNQLVSFGSNTKDVFQGVSPQAANARQMPVGQTYNYKCTTLTGGTNLFMGGGNFGSTWEAILEDSAVPQPNTYKMISPTGFTINASTNGANGLDTGVLTGGLWYYTYVISDGVVNKAGLLSLSNGAPSMPTGYTFRALLGATVASGGSIVNFKQLGNQVWTPIQTFGTSLNVASLTSGNLAALVPPIAKSVSGYGGAVGAAAGVFQVAGDLNGTGSQVMLIDVTAGTVFLGINQGASFSNVPLLTSQTFFYNTDSNPNSIFITGWTY